jgi:hypothetical protein
VRKVIVLGFPSRSVTGPDRQAFIRDLELRMASTDEEERNYLTRMRADVQFPEFRTFCRLIFQDDKGYIWLEVHEEDFERAAQGGGALYHVLNSEGEYLGDTRAPAAGRVMRDMLLGAMTDQETGQEDFVVWRLEPRAERFRYR